MSCRDTQLQLLALNWALCLPCQQVAIVFVQSVTSQHLVAIYNDCLLKQHQDLLGQLLSPSPPASFVPVWTGFSNLPPHVSCVLLLHVWPAPTPSCMTDKNKQNNNNKTKTNKQNTAGIKIS